MLSGSNSKECTVDEAIAESVQVSDVLLAMSRQAESAGTSEQISIARNWNAQAKTYTYHTHVRVGCADVSLVRQVVDCFFHAASLKAQPWYSQFLRGTTLSLQPKVDGCIRCSVCIPEFDFGLGKVHSYRQLLSQFSPADDCFVLVLRSVIHSMEFAFASLPAFTLAPTGDVFHWADGVLHWHHICTVTGVGILPVPIERHVMNGLRWLNLDGKEKNTYREEGEAFIRWVSDPAAVNLTWQSLQAEHGEKVAQ